jgi:hypothetical protein
MHPSSSPARTVAAEAVAPPAAGAVPDTPDTRLRGRGLFLARVGWGACAAVIVGLYLLSLPPYVAFLQTPCRGASCSIHGALDPAKIQALHQLGLSLGGYSALFVAFSVVFVLVSCGIITVIVWRRSEDWMALFVALFVNALAFGSRDAPPDVLPLANAAWWLPVRVGHLLSAVLLYLFFFLFPSGRFVPRWTRWVAAGYILYAFAQAALPRASPLNVENWPVGFSVLFYPYYLPLFLIGLFAQVYRYRRVSTPAQRRQTKWVVLGTVVALGGTLGVLLPPLLVPALQQDGLYSLFVNLVVSVALTFLVVCITVAVLHSRLFDIDVIIRRTLVYGTLTAVLAAVYVGIVIGTQAVVQALTGQSGQQPVFIVASTLLVAALFNPLRRGIQAAIDRRFYRKKYDAERTLAAFGASLGSEADLERMRERVLAVVQQTMQPAHVSLWLRPPERRSTEQTHRLEPLEPTPTKLSSD